MRLSDMFELLLAFSLLLFASGDPSPLFNNMPGTFVISSVDDQIRSAVGSVAIPWPGFAIPDRNPKPPLYGLTYFPWRTKKDCSNITAADIESDIKLISELAASIYVYELFCDFGPLLVNLTRHYDMSILIGIPLTNEIEFRRQHRVLRDIVMSGQNLSHIVAISVGHLELAPVIGNRSLTAAVVEKLQDITAMVDSSPFPDIPVTTTDSQENLFRRNLYEHEQIYIGSYNTMDTQRNASLAAAFLYEGLFQIRNADPEKPDGDLDNKPIILTDIGWASDGYFEVRSLRERKPIRGSLNSSKAERVLINDTDQLYFLYNLHCPQFALPPMYYVHSAFDLTWKYAANESSAHWGLADAETRHWKPHIITALTWPCQSGMPTSFDEGAKSGSSRRSMLILIAVCSTLGVVFIAMCILVFCFWRWKRQAVRKLKRTQQQHMDYIRSYSATSAADAESNRYVKDVTRFNARWDDYLNMLEPDYEDLSYLVAPQLRIDLSHLELREIVGEGHFGMVQRAELQKDGVSTEVAVKRLHVGARNVHQFLMEGIKMQKFNHPNVLNLIGISFTPTNLPMIITPFLEEGDVLDYIRKHENKNMPFRRLIDFCYQIAEGMRYLHDLKMIHRDLAARNCMLDKELTVKIADFGLCRDISEGDSYQTTKAFELPIRWMPPEAIEKLLWTSKSDVWSYGVVMWELLSRGQQPYSDVALIELRAFLKNGGRLGKPAECPRIIYEIMEVCWSIHPNSRPEFKDLCQVLPVILHALDNGDNLEDSDCYNAISPLVTSLRATRDSDAHDSPPQSPPPHSSVKRRSIPFIRDLFRRSTTKRGPARITAAGRSARKNSLP